MSKKEIHFPDGTKFSGTIVPKTDWYYSKDAEDKQGIYVFLTSDEILQLDIQPVHWVTYEGMMTWFYNALLVHGEFLITSENDEYTTRIAAVVSSLKYQPNLAPITHGLGFIDAHVLGVEESEMPEQADIVVVDDSLQPVRGWDFNYKSNRTHSTTVKYRNMLLQDDDLMQKYLTKLLQHIYRFALRVEIIANPFAEGVASRTVVKIHHLK